jgi:hypothetical protein
LKYLGHRNITDFIKSDLFTSKQKTENWTTRTNNKRR